MTTPDHRDIARVEVQADPACTNVLDELGYAWRRARTDNYVIIPRLTEEDANSLISLLHEHGFDAKVSP